MISRHWKGITKPGFAERYIQHLEANTFPLLANLPGFVRASILRREVDSGTEFCIITEWESLDAVKIFAGPGYETAVVPPAAAAMMVDYDRIAVHYEIVK